MYKIGKITPFIQTLSACHVPGTVLDIMCTVMREIDIDPTLKESIVSRAYCED